MLADALALAHRGKFVVPCLAGTKRAAVSGGVHAATTDLDWITDWWTRHPDDNVAVATGRSHVVVVDLDVRAGRSGIDTFTELANRHDGWPSTRTITTPSGGRHLYFASDVDVRCSSSRLGRNVDVKSGNSYVLSPRSRLGNGSYRVLHDVPPSPMPCWLAALCTPPVTVTRAATPARTTRYGNAALAGELERIAHAVEGERNETLNLSAFLIGQLVAVDLVELEHARAALVNAGVKAGLVHREVVATVKSGLAAGRERPRARTIT